ncbi:hypothetical protein A2866_01775 [Candidatus Roizmanbacteria bacterium RIFCSPHIGHO2_01_FULL_39_8]|uniref:Response regulatory domain-containing protein n=2 Tax=Candidatus Roizmaniibacteriota TaxID=1752723 RepID=A0A1F7GKF9_9BACT|nr:MAG: hypothetical protein A2866_01775 [Candidatus Roizmanbacteria bacterium RIFCSPHIGHO2_01_FULL_39_8]OGK25699.1 MAG: hypothetical protein A3C28_01545 [Candidatus Roizmanbacteria bacterium RIFCSPHIGHO2_02_FULL_39_9]
MIDKTDKNIYPKKKILIIEDDQALMSAYKMKLSPYFELKNAITGEEGMELAHDWKPSLILLDLYLPGKTGQQVLKQLKADGHTKNIPVIVFTNLEDECSKVLNQGARDCAIKTQISMEEILNRINKYLPA